MTNRFIKLLIGACAAAAASGALAATANDSTPTVSTGPAPTSEAPTSYWGRSTWTDPGRGFLWYGADQPPPSKPIEPKTKTPAEMTNEELGAEITRLLNVAVFKQTPEAVKEYLSLQQYAMDRASRFSDVFRRTVWTNPELDYSLRGRPTNTLAIASFDSEKDKKRRTVSESLSKTHGLFFFYRGNCGYCHQLAPILRMYQRNYGVEVFAVSLDGSGLAEFPNAKRDNGSSMNLNVTTVPAVFLANKQTGKVQPLGYGVMALEEIVNRVFVLTQTEPGQEY